MDKIVRIGTMAILAFTVIGCATYRAYNLPTSDVYNLDERQEKNGVTVGVKFFAVKEVETVFGSNTFKNGIEPVYIIIDNQGANTYFFSKRRINKTIIPAEVVVERCGFHTIARTARWGVPGLFLWPLLAPAVIDGLASSKANRKMSEDYAYKEIKDGRIFPSMMLNGCVFVDKMKEEEHFDITICDVETNKMLLFSFKR